MNLVVEWGATTAAGTGRPDRVALCVCVWEGGQQAFSFDEKQTRKVLRSECISPLLQLFHLLLTKFSMDPDSQPEANNSQQDWKKKKINHINK